MNLLGQLRVPHSVLVDRDGDKGERWLQIIQDARNGYTTSIDHFDIDLEEYLGTPRPAQSRQKPQQLMWCYQNGMIPSERLARLREKMKPLLACQRVPEEGAGEGK